MTIKRRIAALEAVEKRAEDIALRRMTLSELEAWIAWYDDPDPESDDPHAVFLELKDQALEQLRSGKVR